MGETVDVVIKLNSQGEFEGDGKSKGDKGKSTRVKLGIEAALFVNCKAAAMTWRVTAEIRRNLLGIPNATKAF